VKVLRIIIISTFICCTLATTAWSADRYGTVSWVYDGDTIKVTGVGVVRLIGVDCPEKKGKERDRKYLRLGAKSSNDLRRNARSTLKRVIKLCKGKRVRIQVGGDKHDRYNRVLAYVWLPDGTMLNRLLLREGRAIVYRRFDFKYKKNFIQLEQQARRQHRGMWHH